MAHATGNASKYAERMLAKEFFATKF